MGTDLLCLFVVLHPRNIYGLIRMGTDLGQYAHMDTL